MLNRWRVALALLLLLTSTAFAQPPDPRDSIILESKVLAPGLVGNPVAFTMKVYITNKDTVAILTLALRESTIVGTAYADLDSVGPAGNQDDGWALADCLTYLKNTLDNNPAEDFRQYNGNSPDRFLVASVALSDFPGGPRDAEPINLVRSAIWELRFMSTDNALGKVQFDAAAFGTLPQPTGMTIVRNRGQFVQDIPVNFLPGVITVTGKGDLNLDFALRPADVVLLLNCVFLGTPPPVGLSYCDLNCDGQTTVVDVALLLNAVFRQEEFPC